MFVSLKLTFCLTSQMQHATNTISSKNVLDWHKMANQQPQQFPNDFPQLRDYLQQLAQRQNTLNWSFTQGFLLGQLSIILLVITVIWYLLLEDGRKPKRKSTIGPLQATAKPFTSPSPSDILTKSLYDLNRQQPESANWLNVLTAQLITIYRDDAHANGRFKHLIDEILNGDVRPDFVGPINMTDLSLGEEFPIFSNVRIVPSHGQIRAEIDFDFTDEIVLGIETQLLVNWPKPRIAALPVLLKVSVVKFSGTLLIGLVPSNSSIPIAHSKNNYLSPSPDLTHYVDISIASDFIIEFTCQSLLGSRTKLESLPKVTELVTTRLRNVLIDRAVAPQSIRVKLPSAWGQQDLQKDELLQEDKKERPIGNLGIPMSGGQVPLVEKAKPAFKAAMEEIVEEVVDGP